MTGSWRAQIWLEGFGDKVDVVRAHPVVEGQRQRARRELGRHGARVEAGVAAAPVDAELGHRVRSRPRADAELVQPGEQLVARGRRVPRSTSVTYDCQPCRPSRGPLGQREPGRRSASACA